MQLLCPAASKCIIIAMPLFGWRTVVGSPSADRRSEPRLATGCGTLPYLSGPSVSSPVQGVVS